MTVRQLKESTLITSLSLAWMYKSNPIMYPWSYLTLMEKKIKYVHNMLCF